MRRALLPYMGGLSWAKSLDSGGEPVRGGAFKPTAREHFIAACRVKYAQVVGGAVAANTWHAFILRGVWLAECQAVFECHLDISQTAHIAELHKRQAVEKVQVREIGVQLGCLSQDVEESAQVMLIEQRIPKLQE